MRKGKGKPGELLEKAADTMMACFRTCAADGYVDIYANFVCRLIMIYNSCTAHITL